MRKRIIEGKRSLVKAFACGVSVPRNDKMSIIQKFQAIVFVVLFFCIFSGTARAKTVKGIFGVPAIQRLQPSDLSWRMKQGNLTGKVETTIVMDTTGVNAVFVPEDGQTIKWFKERGYKVYLSVNAFGGSRIWEKYPDARPVKADGSLVGVATGEMGHGGVCPTHQQWRAERLSHIKKL